jgi:MFS transporter, UMF1 family
MDFRRATAEQRGWFFYDFANSAFASTVLTLFLGPYLTSLAQAAAGPDGHVHPFGLSLEPRSIWSFCISLSVISQVLTLPIVGAIADDGRKKRELLALFAFLGAGATMSMYFLAGDRYLLGVLLFFIANLSFGCANVVYNSFLPEIAPPADRDSVSSTGWALGYLGGGTLLILNLILYSNAAALGLPESMAVRISLASAGLWWAIFTLIPLRALRNRAAANATHSGSSALADGFRQLGRTIRQLPTYPETLTFLTAYLLYNDAIQAIIALSGQFGADELKMPMGQLTTAILMVQFVAAAGAALFSRIAARITAKRAIMLALVCWSAILIYVYLGVKSANEFFLMAAFVGLIMGGSQALSRSLYSLMIPKGCEAEYYSLYEVSDKGTSWMAPLIFGIVLQITKSYRFAILSLIGFFIIGLAVLTRVNVDKAAREAARSTNRHTDPLS